MRIPLFDVGLPKEISHLLMETTFYNFIYFEKAPSRKDVLTKADQS